MLSYLPAISCSYLCIFSSTCFSSCEIFTSKVSIFSSSLSRFARSSSKRDWVFSAFCSWRLLKSRSSCRSLKWASGDVSAESAIIFEIFSSNTLMFCCLSASFLSSSSFRAGNESMNWVISWSFVNSTSYFCWSWSSLFSCASFATCLMRARRFSFSVFSSKVLFSAATMSALSFLTLLSSSSLCSGTLRLPCWTSSSSTCRRPESSSLSSDSCWKRARKGSWRSRCSSAPRWLLTLSSSSRASKSSRPRRMLSSRRTSYSCL
mmetsp:Transcript_5189/g.13921  ORF Transcript_5189/g.13921 Transcript_5189/m.13921 type:complete len:263 (+) Transcript_5189:548-1336(+)